MPDILHPLYQRNVDTQINIVFNQLQRTSQCAEHRTALQRSCGKARPRHQPGPPRSEAGNKSPSPLYCCCACPDGTHRRDPGKAAQSPSAGSHTAVRETGSPRAETPRASGADHLGKAARAIIEAAAGVWIGQQAAPSCQTRFDDGEADTASYQCSRTLKHETGPGCSASKVLQVRLALPVDSHHGSPERRAGIAREGAAIALDRAPAQRSVGHVDMRGREAEQH